MSEAAGPHRVAVAQRAQHCHVRPAGRLLRAPAQRRKGQRLGPQRGALLQRRAGGADVLVVLGPAALQERLARRGCAEPAGAVLAPARVPQGAEQAHLALALQQARSKAACTLNCWCQHQQAAAAFEANVRVGCLLATQLFASEAHQSHLLEASTYVYIPIALPR